jgi:hypothetical protein
MYKGEDNLFLQIGIITIILQILTSNVDERLALTRHKSDSDIGRIKYLMS